jgi:hypothetical protein
MTAEAHSADGGHRPPLQGEPAGLFKSEGRKIRISKHAVTRVKERPGFQIRNKAQITERQK